MTGDLTLVDLVAGRLLDMVDTPLRSEFVGRAVRYAVQSGTWSDWLVIYPHPAGTGTWWTDNGDQAATNARCWAGQLIPAASFIGWLAAGVDATTYLTNPDRYDGVHPPPLEHA